MLMMTAILQHLCCDHNQQILQRLSLGIRESTFTMVAGISHQMTTVQVLQHTDTWLGSKSVSILRMSDECLNDCKSFIWTCVKCSRTCWTGIVWSSNIVKVECAKCKWCDAVDMYSHEVIYGMVPDSHHKLLNNMRKTQQRKERRKVEETSIESSHAADDDWPRKRKHDTYVGCCRRIPVICIIVLTVTL